MTTVTQLILLMSAVVLLIIVKLVIGKNATRMSNTHKHAGKRISGVKNVDLGGYIFPSGIKAGNIQTIGNSDFQSTYFATIQNESQSEENLSIDGITLGAMNDPLTPDASTSTSSALLSVVAAGLTNDESGKLAAVLAVEVLKHYFKRGLHKVFSTEDFFEESFKQMRRSFRDNINLNNIGVKLAAVIADGGILHYAVVGDCVLYLYRNNELISLKNSNRKHEHDKRIGSIAIKPKDVVMIANQGASESLTEMEILWHLDLDNHPQEKCQMLLKRAQEKRVRLGNWVSIVLEGLPAAER